MKNAIHRALKKLEIAVACLQTAPCFSRSYRRMLSRGLRWHQHRGFTVEEMRENGLLDPDLPDEQIELFLSRKEATALQKAVNPLSFAPLLKNKAFFYKYLSATGLPHPEVLAIFNRQTAGVSSSGRILSSREDWIDYLENETPDEFMIKPIYGATGRGIKRLLKENHALTDGENRMTCAGLYDLMQSYPDSPGYLLQRRAFNHPAIVEFTAKETLHTLRIVTYVNRDRRPEVLFAALKFILDSGVIDNFRHGQTGNLFGFIDTEKGRIKSVIRKSAGEKQAVFLDRHPITQRSFSELAIPCWAESLDLVYRAALEFLPIRSIGWDVAVTPEGPCLIEGNFWWDPYNRKRYKHRIIEDLGFDPFQEKIRRKPL